MENKARILIIDDEEVVLDSCAQILKGGNFQIATAMNGDRGLKLVREFEPDLVYVDLKMPGISGFDVIERIRESDPTIVTIVITGYATVSSAIEAMKNGAYDYLPKPFTPDEFRLITQRGLDRRRLVLETIALRKEKEMLRENFAAIVSHELKAPLGAVQQNLFVLVDELSDQLTEEQKNRFERMKTNINDLISLILTWLRVLSVDMSKIRESFKPVSLASVILKAVDSVQPHAIRKDIEIVSSINESLNSVNGDEGTLVETIINILGNAIKYSRSASQIHVKAEEDGNDVLISVADTGPGISKEELPYIFNDFYTGESGKAAERGSGIGLAVSRRIVEAHNGSISAESEFGKGSTFVIRLPAVKPELHTELEPNGLAKS
ncbi:MAG: hybrid sensor histidine kinase/response regulator [Chloroflexi bacterium]|nr:hybrid sensor histidine kinase/response regulator [Chloroflexota bacterium]